MGDVFMYESVSCWICDELERVRCGTEQHKKCLCSSCYDQNITFDDNFMIDDLIWGD